MIRQGVLIGSLLVLNDRNGQHIWLFDSTNNYFFLVPKHIF